jgi:septin family protein
MSAVAYAGADLAIADYREKKISKGQLTAALMLAGATAAGATAFVASMDHSSSTPMGPSGPSVSQNGGHKATSAVPANDQVGLHNQHMARQTAR